MPRTSSITRLLHAAQDGDVKASDALYSEVYEELRRIAHARLSRFRPGGTLDTAALVHEAYLKLIDQDLATYKERAHFFATASRAMRFILIDYARTRTRDKRGGSAADVPLDAIQLSAEERAADLVALDDALAVLAERDVRLARLVDYRFFGGMTYEEIAAVTEQSIRTVKRDWDKARTWLYSLMRS